MLWLLCPFVAFTLIRSNRAANITIGTDPFIINQPHTIIWSRDKSETLFDNFTLKIGLAGVVAISDHGDDSVDVKNLLGETTGNVQLTPSVPGANEIIAVPFQQLLNHTILSHTILAKTDPFNVQLGLDEVNGGSDSVDQGGTSTQHKLSASATSTSRNDKPETSEEPHPKVHGERPPHLILIIILPIALFVLLSAALILYRCRRQRRRYYKGEPKSQVSPLSPFAVSASPDMSGSDTSSRRLTMKAANRKQVHRRGDDELLSQNIAPALPTSLTERQRELSMQAETIRTRLMAFQEFSSNSSSSQDQIRGGSEEMRRMRELLESILNLREGDWARGVTDDPPPAYEDLRRWDSGRVL